jgi:hypothetical protein
LWRSGGRTRAWCADRIGYQLTRDEVFKDAVVPVPGRSSIYRALMRNGLVVPGQRRRRRTDYQRWERVRPMELWQMDVVGRARRRLPPSTRAAEPRLPTHHRAGDVFRWPVAESHDQFQAAMRWAHEEMR